MSDDRLRQIILKMTAQNPNDRYQSMQEVINTLKNLNVVSSNPKTDFWEDVGKASLVLGGIVLGGLILDAIFNKR